MIGATKLFPIFAPDFEKERHIKMKRLIITTVIVLGLGMSALANPESSLFQRSSAEQLGRRGENTGEELPLIPSHGQGGAHQDAESPIGSGIAVLAAFGAAYLIGKKRDRK